MSDESYSFSTARARLEEIVTQVRKKDTSLEKSLDLLEEGVRLANACTELIDHADWTVGGGGRVRPRATESAATAERRGSTATTSRLPATSVAGDDGVPLRTTTSSARREPTTRSADGGT